MADAKTMDNFIKNIPPPFNYLDVGFDRFFDRGIYRQNYKSAADFNSEFESVSFNRISQGVATSSGGKIKIDFEKGRITISDGSLDRIIIGELT